MHITNGFLEMFVAVLNFGFAAVALAVLVMLVTALPLLIKALRIYIDKNS